MTLETAGPIAGTPRGGDREVIYRLLSAVVWPSEAYWRAIEMAPLRTCPHLRAPILEVGCGEGGFTEVLGLEVDHAIDLNPRAAEVAAARPNYGSVEVIDMHDLAGRDEGRYRTVFANSVLEHVDDLESALATIRRLLSPSGALVATVPLADMNRHLALSADAYVSWRQNLLEHRNLWSRDGWRQALSGAGFAEVELTGYLTGAECEYWDRIDAAGNLGAGRVRVAPVARRVGGMLPATARVRLKRLISERLARRIGTAAAGEAESCAALVVARVPAEAG